MRRSVSAEALRGWHCGLKLCECKSHAHSDPAGHDGHHGKDHPDVAFPKQTHHEYSEGILHWAPHSHPYSRSSEFKTKGQDFEGREKYRLKEDPASGFAFLLQIQYPRFPLDQSLDKPPRLTPSF